MSGYGIEPDPVYGSGKNIHSLGPDAYSSANNVLQSIADAQGIVHHPQVSSALGAFYDDHSKDAHALMYSVEDCGGKIATTANICVDGENEQTASYGVGAGQGEETHSALNRPI